MSAAYTIRPATPTDASALQELFALCITQAAWLPAAARSSVDFAAASKDEYVLVAVDSSGALLGLLAVQLEGSYVHHLYIHPAARGQGLGRQLLATLQPCMVSPWRLKCVQANLAGLAFYSRLGWQMVDTGVGDHGFFLTLEWNAPVALALREPALSDYLCLSTWVSDAKACTRWAGPQLRYPFRAAELPVLLSLPGAVSYCIAQGQDGPLGFGQHWVVTPGRVHLGRIMVHPEQRGRGYGQVLVQQLMARALQTTGATAVTLRVYRDNHTALALYRRLGFGPLEAESTEDLLFMLAAAPVICSD